METSNQRSNSGSGLSIVTWVAILATLIVNSLSNVFPPGGQNVGEIANSLLSGVLIIPENYAFAIWGVIYLGLIAYGVYQFQCRHRQDVTIQTVNKLLIGACVAQIIWIFLFTLQLFGLSILAMLAILIPLILIYRQLGIGLGRVSKRRLWMVHIPFSIYLAWISVATIVNVAAALYVAGLTDDRVVWTVGMLVVATVIGAVVIWQRRDVAFTGVLVWADVAIAIRQFNFPAITYSALAMALLLGLLIGWRRFSLPNPQERPTPDA